MSAADLLRDLAKDEAQPVELIPLGIIAEFANGHDARDFARVKRAQGQQVTITPGINLMYAVRPLVKVS